MKADNKPPFYLVSKASGRHHGQFTTYTDAMLARYIAGPEYVDSIIMDVKAFAKHLKRIKP